MISAGDLRKGTTFEHEGQVYTVIEFLHVKPGKGAAFVRTKLRNVISGGVTDTTFNPTTKLQEAVIERKEMQYLYSDGELYYFMDQETFEQIPLNYEKVEDAIKFIKENMFATGAVVNVPMFVNEGDVIRVDTRTGEYMERV